MYMQVLLISCLYLHGSSKAMQLQAGNITATQQRPPAHNMSSKPAPSQLIHPAASLTPSLAISAAGSGRVQRLKR